MPRATGRETYVRFVVARRDTQSDQRMGIFTALYDLDRAGELTSYEGAWFATVERWFDKNLKRPADLAWSSRPNAPRRAISWMKMSAPDHVSRLRELVELLRYKDIEVKELRTEKPGYIVFEDDFQVAAIPFSETI